MVYIVDKFFFFKQKTAYEIKECDWSSDVCSSDLADGSRKRYEDLIAGIVPRLGSGGSRLTEVDRATREILTGIYAQWCIPNGAKAAKAGRKGLEAICDTRPGIGEADTLWPKIVAGAERLVASRKAVLADLGTETRDYIQD